METQPLFAFTFFSYEVGILFQQTMSDIESDDEILEAMGFPMSSKIDPIQLDDFGWTGTDHESIDNTNEDPEFQLIL